MAEPPAVEAPAPATVWQRLTDGEPWRTIPNAITAVRIALLPVVVGFLAAHWFAAAAVTAAVVFLTDFLDGFVARRFNQASALGRWLDPAADRATVVALAIGMAWTGVLPVDLVVLVVLPDLLLAALAVLFFRGAAAVPVSTWGKVRTALLFTGFVALLAAAVVTEAGLSATWLARGGVVLFGAGVVASFVSGVFYSIAAARRLLSAEADRRTLNAPVIAGGSPPDRAVTALR